MFMEKASGGVSENKNIITESYVISMFMLCTFYNSPNQFLQKSTTYKNIRRELYALQDLYNLSILGGFVTKAHQVAATFI